MPYKNRPKYWTRKPRTALIFVCFCFCSFVLFCFYLLFWFDLSYFVCLFAFCFLFVLFCFALFLFVCWGICLFVCWGVGVLGCLIVCVLFTSSCFQNRSNFPNVFCFQKNRLFPLKVCLRNRQNNQKISKVFIILELSTTAIPGFACCSKYHLFDTHQL